MATNLTLNIKADASGLKAVKDVLKDFETSAGSAARLYQEFRKLKGEMQALKTQAASLESSLVKQTTAAKKDSEEVKKLGTEVKKLSDDNKKLTTETDKSSKKLKDQAAAAKKSSREMKNLDSFTRGAAGGAGKLWLVYGNLIPMLAGFSTAVGAIKFTSMTTSFEYEMETIRALGGSTKQEISDLKDEVLAIRSIKGPSELVSGLKTLTKSGFDAQESINGVKDIALLAELGTMGLSDAAKIATRSVRIFGLEESQLSYVANVLAYTASNANMEVSDLGNAMSYTTELATLLDFGLEETAAAMSVLHDKGISASKAGTALRTSFIRMAAPTGKTAEAMERLGVSVSKPGGGQKDLATIVGELSRATKGLDHTAKASIFRDIAGLRAEKALIALVQAFEEGNLEQKLDDINEKGGDYLSTFEGIIGETARGEWKKLSAAVESVVQQFAKEVDFDSWLGNEIRYANENLTSLESRAKQTYNWFKLIRGDQVEQDSVTGGALTFTGFLPNLYKSLGIVADATGNLYKSSVELTDKTLAALPVIGKHLIGGGNFDREMWSEIKKVTTAKGLVYKNIENSLGEIGKDYTLAFQGRDLPVPGSKVDDNNGGGKALNKTAKEKLAALKKETNQLQAELNLQEKLVKGHYDARLISAEEYQQSVDNLKLEALGQKRYDLHSQFIIEQERLTNAQVAGDELKLKKQEEIVTALIFKMGLVDKEIEQESNLIDLLETKRRATVADNFASADLQLSAGDSEFALASFKDEASKRGEWFNTIAEESKLAKEHEINLWKVQTDKITQEYEKRLETEKLNKAEQIKLQTEHDRVIVQAEKEKDLKIARIDHEAAERKKALAFRTMDDGLSIAGSLMSIMQTMSDDSSRKDFERNKKLSMALAVANTAAGITKTFATLGWPAGIVGAAAVAASGAAQIATIANTSFEGTSPSIASVSGGSAPASVGTVTAPTVSDSTVTGTGATHNITFEVSAMDSRDVSRWISQSKGQIVSLIQEAYDERGTSGGPING